MVDFRKRLPAAGIQKIAEAIALKSMQQQSVEETEETSDAEDHPAMLSKIDPMKKIAKMLRRKRELILNWFVAEGKLSSGVVEGFNNKLKLITRKSYCFRTQKGYETALYHSLSHLPEPNFTHIFF